MFGTKDKKEKEEKIIVKTTEKFRIFTKGIKWISIVIVSIIGLYLLYLAFGFYVYGSFIISFILSSLILYNTIQVPTERFVESRIEMEVDEKGNKKPRTHIFNEYDIPTDLLKEFTLKGDTIIRFVSKNGVKRNIVNKIDWDNKIIYYSWFASYSDWDFMIVEETFKLVKEKLEDTTRDLLRHEKTRELYWQIQLLKEYQDMNTESEEYGDNITKLVGRIKEIYQNG